MVGESDMSCEDPNCKVNSVITIFHQLQLKFMFPPPANTQFTQTFLDLKRAAQSQP